MTQAVRGGEAEPSAGSATQSDVHIREEDVQTQADTISTSLQDVFRETGWFLLRRAQLARDGRAAEECIPLLRPLAQQCRTYIQNVSALRDQLLCAQVRLERLLEQAGTTDTEPAVSLPSGTEPVVGMETPLEQLDLYSMISTMPLDWTAAAAAAAAAATTTPTPSANLGPLESSASDLSSKLDTTPAATGEPEPASKAPGTDPSVPISIESDDEERAPKRPKLDTSTEASQELVSALLGGLPSTASQSTAEKPRTEMTSSNTGAHPLAASSMDFSWLDFDSMSGSTAGTYTDLLPGDTSEAMRGLAGLDLPGDPLDFSSQLSTTSTHTDTH